MRLWHSVACAVALVGVAVTAIAADHRDSPSTIADPAADINDVYTFVDGDRAVFAMTVFPIADETSQFSDQVQYVLNLTSGAAFGEPGDEARIMCTFDAAQVASCWVGRVADDVFTPDDYVTGDASGAEGITSDSGLFQVFTGLRADPFFFNLEGFQDAVSTVVTAAPTLTFDSAGCPQLDQATSGVLVGMLQGTNSGTAPAEDFFGPLNTLAIVVSVDKSLVTSGGSTVSVWGSTHQAP